MLAAANLPGLDWWLLNVGSKDTPPASVFAVYDELKRDEMKCQFTISALWTMSPTCPWPEGK